MKTRKFLLLMIAAASLAGCRKDQEPNKIIDGLPLHVTEVVMPAYALQQVALLKRDNIREVITTINKTSVSGASFAELTNTSSNTYQFSLNEAHYGSALVTMQFYDATGAAIDPIITRSSTSTIKTVAINSTGSSGLFSYVENGAITLDIAGNINSTMRSSGTVTTTGSDFAISFAVTTPSRVTIDGFREGLMTASGSRQSNAAPVLMNISMANGQNLNGNMTWDGQDGSVHIGSNGIGFVITGAARIPIE